MSFKSWLKKSTQNVTRKGYIKMNFAELDYYMDTVETLKDAKKEFPDETVILIIRLLLEVPVEKRTIKGGIAFLIANAIRKHRGLAYPA